MSATSARAALGALLLCALLLSGAQHADGRKPPRFALAVAPGELTVRQCIPAALEVAITNTSSTAGFVDVDVTTPPAVTASSRTISTYVPAGGTVRVGVRISAPPGAAPGEHAVLFETGREEVAVPVTVLPESGVQCLPRERMTATATSAQFPAYLAPNAIDGLESTMWHTRYSPAPADALPQSITLELGATYDVTELSYQPRLDNRNGRITDYEISASGDGVAFTPVASGIWDSTTARKVAQFSASGARFIRLTARAGVGGFASAAEIVLFGRPAG